MKKYSLLALFLLFILSIHADKKPIKVACVGNSITYGYTLPDREKECYPTQLQQMLGSDYIVGNFGKSGATLLNKGHRPYTQQEEYRKAIEFAGDIVVIHLGVNDTDPRNWPHYRDQFIPDYIALINSFRQANPDCRILIARLTPITDRHPRFESGTRDWRDQIQRAIETVAQYTGVQLIDFHEPLYNYPHIMHDAIHPTAEGATILARTVYSGITGDYGGLQLSPLFGDGMILQRDCPLTIRGIANAGDKVMVRIAGQKHKTRADLNGKWSVTLNPLKAGNNYSMFINSDSGGFQFHHVAAGEVWLCSGQSNMEFALSGARTAKEDIAQAGNNDIRLFDMKARWRTNDVEWDKSVLDSLNHLQYYTSAMWQPCSPETAASFSAIAYHFGRVLQDSLDVPVGLICNAIGGSPTEAWIDRGTLEHEFPAILRNWRNNDFIQDWVRGRGAKNIALSTDPLQRHPYEPCYLYESGILPLDQYPIKGVIWYQGESNAHNIEAHEKLFQLLVKSWRNNWNNPTLPFYYVQLSSIDRPSWCWFRDSQRRMMDEISHTGMAVSSDHGDSLDVHPTHKRPIGERLARWALNQTYQQSHIVPSGPLFRTAEFDKRAAYISFDYSEGLKSSDGEPLRAFEIAETEGIYHPATAEIKEGRIKVYHPKVKNPHYVRYGWQPFTRANLVNSEGLPASTFQAKKK